VLIPKRDPPIRIVSSAFFSLGILQRARIELSHFLFSNILKVSNASVLIGVSITLLLLVPRLHQVKLLGSLFGASGSLLGMYASYSLNTVT
jgi:ABC-type Mn2+/Zn2+ transport system permease subunit